MDHEQQADVAAIKIVLVALLMEVADPGGTRSKAETDATLAGLRQNASVILANLTIDVSRSSAEAASPFHEAIADKIGEIFGSITAE